MKDQAPLSNPEPLDRREGRLADPSRGGSWITGVILIVLGGLFLLRNTGTLDISLRNWWALFILIPAIGAFDTALRTYRHAGNQLTAPARSSFLVGTVLTFVTFMFLFDLSWPYFGPVLIILVGIALILNYTLDGRNS